MTLGRCKHGTFALLQGCKLCIEDQWAETIAKTLLPEGGLAEAAQAAGAEVTVAKVNYKMEELR